LAKNKVLVWLVQQLLQSHSPTDPGLVFSITKFEKKGTLAVELINESLKKAKRHQAEGVSSADVQQASQYLVSNPSHKMFRHAGPWAVYYPEPPYRRSSRPLRALNIVFPG
jgi:hypothetical protein